MSLGRSYENVLLMGFGCRNILACSAQFSEDMRCAEIGPRQAYQLIDEVLIVLCEVTTFLVLPRN